MEVCNCATAIHRLTIHFIYEGSIFIIYILHMTKWRNRDRARLPHQYDFRED